MSTLSPKESNANGTQLAATCATVAPRVLFVASSSAVSFSMTARSGATDGLRQAVCNGHSGTRAVVLVRSRYSGPRRSMSIAAGSGSTSDIDWASRWQASSSARSSSSERMGNSWRRSSGQW
eukprot:CAMPEP_0114608528 /NCGR_PEP_ID=MMETSP0168-20121206/2625_1 /TAXON_ID=95228 ORGANISM="Vannella sp., Strain DIVA3 517/6/12" /NCGR_SAMPLE_ID=MMETSP0168 /ASSEMBLY_ACC=CAM_ASM_000044 /LENGTH=121 /DNA_ID=CAMNT_0001819429 /DNA_START=350 /DNA_END=715 /DNA_ORIENTATION=-